MGVLTSLDVVVQDEDCLLQIVDGRECAGAADACAAVQHYFVVGGNAGQLLLVKEVLAAALAIADTHAVGN